MTTALMTVGETVTTTIVRTAVVGTVTDTLYTMRGQSLYDANAWIKLWLHVEYKGLTEEFIVDLGTLDRYKEGSDIVVVLAQEKTEGHSEKIKDCPERNYLEWHDDAGRVVTYISEFSGDFGNFLRRL